VSLTLPRKSSFVFVAVLVFSFSLHASNFSMSGVNAQVDVSVTTGYNSYFPNEQIEILGHVYNTTGDNLTKTGFVKIKAINSYGKPVYQTTIPIEKDGVFADPNLRLEGHSPFRMFDLVLGIVQGQKDKWAELSRQQYNITATVYFNNKIPSAAWTLLNVREYFTAPGAIMLYLGLFDLLLLIVVLCLPSRGGKNRLLMKRIFAFVFISGITLSPIMSIFLTNSQVGTNSPIGIIRGFSSTWGNDESEWFINIGGHVGHDKVTGGIQIPVFIVIFGIAGGYLRYLYEIASTWKEEIRDDDTFSDESKDNKNNQTHHVKDSQLFFRSLERLSIIFLSPLLSMAVWFILFEGGARSNYTLAAVAITVGILMNDIVARITKFSKDALGGEGGRERGNIHYKT
jgi:hypothetical protein